MSVKINKPLVVTTEQTFEFYSYTLTRHNGNVISNIVFNILDTNGKRVDTKSIRLDGADHNSFWTDFNSGKYLFETLLTKIGESDEIQNISNTIEDYFINQ